MQNHNHTAFRWVASGAALVSLFLGFATDDAAAMDGPKNRPEKLVREAFDINNDTKTNAAVKSKKFNQDDPLVILQEIYGRYPPSEPLGSWHRVDFRNLVPLEDLPLSTATKKLVERSKTNPNPMVDVCYDSDPVTDSQDPTGITDRYKIVEYARNGDAIHKYKISLTGKQAGQYGSRKVRDILYVFTKESGRWYIDDIITAYGNESIAGRTVSLKAELRDCSK
jgi:hypothetical protein